MAAFSLKKLRHKFSRLRTPKQQANTETANVHPNNKPTPDQLTYSSDETVAMEQPKTITHHPSELLRQLYKATNWRHPEISVIVPVVTTWKTVLRAIDSAPGEVDGPIWVHYKRRTESQRQKLRQTALQNVKDSSSSAEGCTIPISADSLVFMVAGKSVSVRG